MTSGTRADMVEARHRRPCARLYRDVVRSDTFIDGAGLVSLGGGLETAGALARLQESHS